MLSKKRNKEETSLHEDESVVYYQNRCLVSYLKDSRKENKEIEEKLNILNGNNQYLYKIFMEMNCRLLNLNENLNIIISQSVSAEESNIINIKKSYSKELILNQNDNDFEKDVLNIGLKLLNSMKYDNIDFVIDEKEKFSISNEYFSLIENIKNNIQSITEGLVGLFNKSISFQQSNEIDLKKDAETNQTNQVNIKLNSISSIEENILKINENIKKVRSQQTRLELEMSDKKFQIDDLNKKCSLLKEENQKLNLRIKTNPIVPLIKYTEEFFKNENIPHDCICHVCGKEFIRDMKEEKELELNDSSLLDCSNNIQNNKENLKINSQGLGLELGRSHSQVQGNPQNHINNVNISLNKQASNPLPYQHNNVIIVNNNSFDNEKLERIQQENDDLKRKISCLIKENQDLKVGFKFNEAHIIESEAFKSIITQAQGNILEYDKLKSLLVAYEGKYQKIFNENISIKQYEENKESAYREEVKKQKDVFKNEIQLKQKEINDLKEIINQYEINKESNIDYDSVYSIFKKENTRLMKELEESIKNINDLRTRLQLENEKKKEIEIENVQLAKQVEKSQEGDKVKEKDKAYLVQRLESKLKERDNELKYEKELNNTFLNDMIGNDLAVKEMTDEINKLCKAIEDEKKKITKLTQDKIQEHIINESLIKEREVYISIQKEIEEGRRLQTDQMKGYEEERKVRGLIIEHLNEEILGKDEEIRKGEEKINEINKVLEETKSVIVQQSKVINELSKENERLKIKDVMNEESKDKEKLKENSRKDENLNEIIDENEKMRQRLKCSVCNMRYKDTIIIRCYHTFCEVCIKKCISSRSRYCPFCREKFSESEVKNFYLNY